MSEEENWTLQIKPKRKLFDIPIREIIRYREMLFLFVRRDFVMQYKQTILGPLWFVINPLLSTVIYTFVFGQLANIGTDGIPHTLFYYSGTMLWAFFSGCFNDSCNVFIANAGLFGKVYFPRLIIPINYALSNVIKIAVQFALLLVFLFYFIYKGYPLSPSWFVLLLPFLIIWLAAIGVGAGIIVSSLTTKYRDLNKLVVHALTLAMYVTPVVYPLSEIPARFNWIAYINPICAPVELFRQWFFGSGSASIKMISASLIITFLLVIGGLILFNQNEQNFIDVI
jgi:lipopolysaccharide transport system permease protein